MLFSLVLCMASIGAAIALLQRQGQSFGLPVAYLICLASIHLPGALAHWLHPWALPGYPETVEGLKITSLSMLSFVVGIGWIEWRQQRFLKVANQSRAILRVDPRFWRFCAQWGLMVGFILSPLRILPSVGAVIQNAGLLWIAGVILAIRFHSSAKGNPRALLRWVGVSLINPFLSLFGQGFLSYGITALTQVYSFLLVRRRRLLQSLAAVAFASYLGLGIGVTYLATRDDIRAAVWGGGTAEQRIEAIAGTLGQLTLFDPSDIKQAELLDLRLNQNFLVGASAFSIESGRIQLESGRTFLDAVIALIPRALWPSKPVVGGSGDLVSNAAGILFAEGTSVGIGNVMELYVNFGFWGIAMGFAALGALLRWLDLRAFRAEARGDYQLYLSSLMPALASIQPGGSFAEVTSSVAAAWIAARLWFQVWKRRQGRSHATPKFAEGFAPR